MKKVKVKLVLLGHVGRLFDSTKIRKWNSSFFEIIDVLIKPALSISDHSDTLDVEYSNDNVSSLLEDTTGEFVIGVMSYPYNDNFYMHRAGDNKACISIANIDSILRNSDISIENFIIKNIYAIILLHELFSSINNDDIYQFPHRDTRGCLFDMNGDVRHVVYNTETPSLCDECLAKIQRKSLPSDWLIQFQKELKSIKKTRLLKMELWVRKYPFLTAIISILISSFLGFIISIVANCLTKKMGW